jgi:hypothetical protein
MNPEINSKMQECKKDYSSYMEWMQGQKGTYTIISGFTFTTITLLIIYLPNPNSVLSQLIMLLLTIILDLLLFLILLMGVESLQFCKDIPQYMKSLDLCNNLSNIVFVLWGFSVPLIYLLWDFVYLAVLSAIIWIILMVISNFAIKKPFEQYRRIENKKNEGR